MEVKMMNLRKLKKEAMEEALEEAMQSLGYLKFDAFIPMLKLLLSSEGVPSKQLATKHRKQGKQLSAEEKKSLGIRVNSFFSKRAFAELTEKGIKNPSHAHYLTLWRARMYASRARSVRLANEAECYGCTIRGGLREECPVCARLDGKKVSANEARPQGAEDCPREVCVISYSPFFNDDL